MVSSKGETALQNLTIRLIFSQRLARRCNFFVSQPEERFFYFVPSDWVLKNYHEVTVVKYPLAFDHGQFCDIFFDDGVNLYIDI